MNYHFDTDIAEKYGVNVAIFLQNISFWTVTNIASDSNFYDGRFWTWNGVKGFLVMFSFWTQKQVRTIIEKCVGEGLLIKGNYHESKYDQRLWYALTDKGLALFDIDVDLLIRKRDSKPESSNRPNGQMKHSKRETPIAQKGDCTIADFKTQIIKPEREESPSPKLISSNFKPSQKQTVIAKEYGLDIDEQKKEFIEHFQGTAAKKTKWRPSFTKWLKRSNEYNLNNKKKYPSKESSAEKNNYMSAVNSSLCINDPKHPAYEARMKEDERWEKERKARADAREQSKPKVSYPERPESMSVKDYLVLLDSTKKQAMS